MNWVNAILSVLLILVSGFRIIQVSTLNLEHGTEVILFYFVICFLPGLMFLVDSFQPDLEDGV